MTNTSVLRNTGRANAPAGSAHGGGIWNSSFGGGPPFGTLTLTNSTVSGNALTARGGITPVGGGLYTDWTGDAERLSTSTATRRTIASGGRSAEKERPEEGAVPIRTRRKRHRALILVPEAV